MTKRFWIILPIALAVVGGIVFSLLQHNQAVQLRLTGSVLKVRTYPLTPDATLVVADFRVNNPTDTRFKVESLDMLMDRADGDPVPGDILTAAEMETVFKYQKLTGPKYNEPLIIRDEIAPGATIDRMTMARIDLPESAIDRRTNLRITIHELSGRQSEIAEHPTEEK